MKRLAFALLSWSFAAMPAMAGDIFPQSPAGQVARNYVVAYNAGDAAMRAFLRGAARPGDAPTAQEDLTRYHDLSRELGAMTPLRILRASAGSVEFEAGVAAGGTATITVLTSGSPARFDGLRIIRKVEKTAGM
jgi:hypothetical protein